MDSSPVLWGVRGGPKGEVEALFLRSGLVALGWDRTGDLSYLPQERAAFRTAVATAYPRFSSAKTTASAGQLFRFVTEMKPGDLVVFPAKLDRLVHLGRVEGGYEFSSSGDESFPHRRLVRWMNQAARGEFTQGALYELGSSLTLFQIKRHAPEFLSALGGKLSAVPLEEDATVAEVSLDIRRTTRDYVLKTLEQGLKGQPMIRFVADLLRTMGYWTREARPGAPDAPHILAHRDPLGFEPPIVRVHVHGSSARVPARAVSDLHGQLGKSEFGLFVTLGDYAPEAQSFARAKTNLRLISGEELVDLISAHYGDLSPEYRSAIPLRRAFVPATTEEHED
jgi:restriction system protein